MGRNIHRILWGNILKKGDRSIIKVVIKMIEGRDMEDVI